MKYTFDHDAIPRYGQSIKWNIMYDKMPEVKTMDVIPFTVAEMEWGTAPEIKDALLHYVNTHHFGYTQPSDAYYTALSTWLKKTSHIDVKQEDVVIMPGVISAIRTAIELLTQEGDGIVLNTPVYHTFHRIIKESKRTLVDSPLINNEGSYTIDFKHLEACFELESTKMFILCQPHNPIGRIWTHEEMRTLHALSKKHNVIVISDEIHADIVMPGHEHVSYGTIDENAILCTSLSKAFNLAAFKLANIIIKDPKLRLKFSNFATRYGSSGANALAMVATQAGYEKGKPWLDAVCQEVFNNEQIIRDMFKDTEVTFSPLQATYMIWMDFSKYIEKDADLIERLEKEAYFFIDEGSNFGNGGHGFVRMNIAGPKRYMIEACERVLNVINKL